MSAYLSSCDCLSGLAYYWALRSGAPGTHDTPRDSLTRAAYFASDSETAGDWELSRQWAEGYCYSDAGGSPGRAAYQLFLLENQRSLQARYPNDPDMWDSEGYSYQPPRIIQSWVLELQTGQMVGLLRGFEYQACEHDGWQRSVAYQLCRQIERLLVSDLEARDCPDGERPWASWVAPADPRMVQLLSQLGG